jgi:hypothetical protein
MFIMTITKAGQSRKIKASGWTQSEERRAQAAYEADGYTVTFGYGVWR